MVNECFFPKVDMATVRPVEDFHPDQDAQVLRDAMNGIGKLYSVVLSILGSHPQTLFNALNDVFLKALMKRRSLNS